MTTYQLEPEQPVETEQPLADEPGRRNPPEQLERKPDKHDAGEDDSGDDEPDTRD